jgi:hypothetical protein
MPVPPRNIEITEEFLTYGNLPIPATITGTEKAPPERG